jgi:hypothetical protein
MSTYAIPTAPASVATRTVAEVEAAILAAEGPHHIRGRYVRDQCLADRERRRVAEQIVAEAARRAARPCVWCRGALGAGAVDVPGGERMHPACADAFDALVYGPVGQPGVAPADESDALVWEQDRAA